MDVAKLSMDMSSMKTTQGVQISAMKRAMDQAEQTGEQIVEMIEASAVDIKL